MNKLFLLIKHEIYAYSHVYGIAKYMFFYFLMGILSLPMIATPGDISTFATLLIIIISILAMLSFSVLLIKKDVEDGSLDNLLIVGNTYNIAIAKVIALFIVVALPFTLITPIIVVIYNLAYLQAVKIFLGVLLLLIQLSSITILISVVQAYFYVNAHLISIIIIPLIVPGLIIMGLIIKSCDSIYYLLLLLTGISLVIFPVSIILIGYLLDNIYNN